MTGGPLACSAPMRVSPCEELHLTQIGQVAALVAVALDVGAQDGEPRIQGARAPLGHLRTNRCELDEAAHVGVPSAVILFAFCLSVRDMRSIRWRFVRPSGSGPASMGPLSDNRGYGRGPCRTSRPASGLNGPRSDNRGYVR